MKADSPLEHPSLTELQQFVLGKLDDEQSATIELHLYQCEACNQQLNSAATNDSFTCLVREQQLENTKPVEQPLIHIEGYKIISELGRGGMGVVYKAIDLRLKRPVALKVILNGEHASSEQRERLRQEAETIATLHHPGIVQIYEIGEHQGHLYLALELLDAQGLQTVMKTAPHSAKWSAALIKQLAEIIDYSHKNGIIHRDLKPENILFSHPLQETSQTSSITKNPPVVKITDFGLAKCLTTDSQMTKTGVMLGTPHYMSPEQIPDSGEAVSFASDIYALGVLLYQLLSGRLPFASSNMLQILKMLREDDPIAPRQHVAEIPRDLETICLKCLMKKPSDRYLCAQDLAEDLNLFLQDEPIHAKPLNGWQRAVKWARRKPLLAGYISITLCLYGLHIFAMLVLHLPRHQGLFHPVLTFLVTASLLFLYPIQKLLDSEQWQRFGQYGFMILTTAAVTVTLALDGAAQSVPINVYMYLIMGVPLIALHPHIIWMQTLFSLIGYLSLLGVAHWFRPDLQVSVEAAVFFVLNLIFTGILTYLLVRRISSCNRI
jgi:serine/threonine protein kinase